MQICRKIRNRIQDSRRLFQVFAYISTHMFDALPPEHQDLWGRFVVNMWLRKHGGGMSVEDFIKLITMEDVYGKRQAQETPEG